MPLTCVAGTFVQQAGTGAQVVTTGALGSAVVFDIADNRTAAGSSTTLFMRQHGFATAGVTQASICAVADSVPRARVQQTDTACIHLIDSDGVTLARATFTSFGATDFTITWTTNDSVARIIPYFLIVGATSAIVLTKQVDAATGVANYTGAGFEPEFIHTMTSGNTAGAVNQLTSFSDIGMGFASATTAEAALTFDIDTGPGFEKIQVTDACVIGTDAGGAVYNRGNLDAFTADGFDIDWTVAGGQAYFYTLCLAGGGSYKVGSFNQATSTGAQSVTGIGHVPVGMILASQNAAASASVLTNARQSLGFVTSTSARSCNWVGASGTSFNTNLTTDKCIVAYTEGTPTLNAAADLVSLVSDTLNIAWSAADATARQIIYASFGNAAVSDTVDLMGWYRPAVQPRRRLTEVIST